MTLAGEARLRPMLMPMRWRCERPEAAPEPVAAAPVPVEPPSRETVVQTVEEAWRRWRQSPGLPSEVLVTVRARFESALTTVMTTHAAALQGTVFDLEQTKKRMKTLCDDVEGVTRGLPDAALGSTSVSALATLLKEKLAANTIGGRVNEEAKVRAAADRVRRAQMTWRDLGPVPGTEGNQLEARFHRAVRRFFEQHPQFDQPREGHREHRGGHGGDAATAGTVATAARAAATVVRDAISGRARKAAATAQRQT